MNDINIEDFEDCSELDPLVPGIWAQCSFGAPDPADAAQPRPEGDVLRIHVRGERRAHRRLHLRRVARSACATARRVELPPDTVN